MLQRVQPEVGEIRRLGMPEDPEDAALFAELVEHWASYSPPVSVTLPGRQAQCTASCNRPTALEAGLDRRRPDRLPARLARLVETVAPFNRHRIRSPPTRPIDRGRHTRSRGTRQQLGDVGSGRPTRRRARRTRRTASRRRQSRRSALTATASTSTLDAKRRIEAAFRERDARDHPRRSRAPTR